MQLGMIGMGRMGANIVRRLMRDGHECVVYDRAPSVVEALASEGATGVSSMQELAAKLAAPRAVWVMVPAGEITTAVITELADTLESGDTVIDGGNSYYRDDIGTRNSWPSAASGWWTAAPAAASGAWTAGTA